MPELRELIDVSPWAAAHPAANGPSTPAPDIPQLRRIAATIRRNILIMTTSANSGHPGGSLSSVEVLVALYYRVMRHSPSDPHWPDRDRFIISKGHASPVVYAVLADCGYFPREEILTFRQIDSRIQGHVHIKTPGVEFSAGSLGQGFSFAIGQALAARLDGRDYQTYALIGDGECDEGQVWEAAMAASHHRVDNLVAIVDRNRIQNDRFTAEAMELEPFADKWRAFGWHVQECDGHDLGELLEALDRTQETKNQPSCIIARTVKGKGVSFMENNPAFHGKAASQKELEQALAEINAQVAELGR